MIGHRRMNALAAWTKMVSEHQATVGERLLSYVYPLTINKFIWGLFCLFSHLVHTDSFADLP